LTTYAKTLLLTLTKLNRPQGDSTVYRHIRTGMITELLYFLRQFYLYSRLRVLGCRHMLNFEVSIKH